MKKLTHSPEAYVRYMQMSSTNVFIFVEGRDPDPYIYDKVAMNALAGTALGYQLCRAADVGGEGAGGKSALLRYFEFLHVRQVLGGDFKGKRWFSIFFLDKDIDDLLGLQKKSAHVCYTTFYDIENHVYAAGDIREAAAASTSAAVHEVPDMLADNLAWRRRAALLWEDWIVLCLLVSRTGTSCSCGYSQKSCLNDPPNSPAVGDIQKYLEEIKKRSGLAEAAFNALHAAAKLDVRTHFESGAFDKVFKGKWYSAILTADLLEHFKGRQVNRKALEVRLTPAIAQTLQPNAPWVNEFARAFPPLIAQYI